MTLMELQARIRESLSRSMPLSYWVVAEISEIKVNYSGHCYLELVEKGGNNGVPRAKVSAVVWRSTYGVVESYFRSATGSDLAQGMKVLLRVSVNYHELYGLSLVVSDVDPSYTLGDMERQRQQTISQLTEDGVFDMNRSLDIPVPAQRIAVVSSKNAAGFQDFMNELSSAGFGFGVTLFDSFMQGQAMEESIISALEHIADRIDKFDVVVIIRGGGAQSDLAAFDSYRLAGHIAQFPIPVITGIGHDKDESVTDMVAAVSLKTPTAVAAWFNSRMMEMDEWFATAAVELQRLATALVDAEKMRLRENSFLLSRAVTEMTRFMEIRLERLSADMQGRANDNLGNSMRSLDTYRERLESRLKGRFEREYSKLRHAKQMALGRNPDRILALGFAIVRHNGKAVTNSTSLSEGAKLDITLSRGRAEVYVKSTEDER